MDELLRRAVEEGASTVHLKAGSAPYLRVGSELRKLEQVGVLRPEDTEAYAAALFHERAAAQFEREGEADFAYGRPELGRFRVSVFRQRGSVSLVLRRVMPGVGSLERLGLPPVVSKLIASRNGIVLVTGPARSGKSTTLAAMVEHLNANLPLVISTVEDPIEFLFPDKVASITQQEVGVDVPSLAVGVRRAMRRDCDVLVVSEVGTADCVAAVLDAAEGGHLVLGALHTADPVDTVERLIGTMPSEGQPMARKRLAATLRGVISQRLVGEGRDKVLACEVLVVNEKVRDLIEGRAGPDEYLALMRESEFFGMTTLERSLLKLVAAGRLEPDAALPYARNPHEFKVAVIEAGIHF